jgi:hypothetical protein
MATRERNWIHELCSEKTVMLEIVFMMLSRRFLRGYYRWIFVPDKSAFGWKHETTSGNIAVMCVSIIDSVKWRILMLACEGTVKVNQSNYRSREARRVPEGWGSQTSRQSAREGGKLSTLCTGRLYPSGVIPGFLFLLNRKVADRFPMVSLKFFIDKILPAALWSWSRLSL